MFASTFDEERDVVDHHRHTHWPVGVARPILVMEALELQLDVRSAKHNNIIYSRTWSKSAL